MELVRFPGQSTVSTGVSVQHKKYYCTVCRVDLNSAVTYEAHVAGKKHMKAVANKAIVADTSRKGSMPAATANTKGLETIVSSCKTLTCDICLITGLLLFIFRYWSI